MTSPLAHCSRCRFALCVALFMTSLIASWVLLSCYIFATSPLAHYFLVLIVTGDWQNEFPESDLVAPAPKEFAARKLQKASLGYAHRAFNRQEKVFFFAVETTMEKCPASDDL